MINIYVCDSYNLDRKLWSKICQDRYIPAVVVECLGPLSYLIKTVDKELWRRHVDMIKECTTTGNSQSTQQNETEYGYSVSNEESVGLSQQH